MNILKKIKWFRVLLFKHYVSKIDVRAIVNDNSDVIPDQLGDYRLRKYRTGSFGGHWADGFELINPNNDRIAYRCELRIDDISSDFGEWYWREVFFKKNII